MIEATRYHDISCGHRVFGHEGQCAHLHGHNLRIHFTCEGYGLDEVGRVLDFSVIKLRLCNWLETNWDHRFLIWDRDPWREPLSVLDPHGIVAVPFNPTSENMARYLYDVIGPQQLEGLPVTLTDVVIEETRKCSARCSR